jgi:hypothetical protein
VSPARTNDRDGIHLDRLVKSIVLDCALLHFFSSTGRRLACISAIEAVRRGAADNERPVCDFLQKYVASSNGGDDGNDGGMAA